MNKTTAKHPNFSQPDFDALIAKGYTEAEIVEIWNRDRDRGHTSPNPRKDLQVPRLFEEIAQRHDIETLEARNRDCLDFHDVCVASLRSMMAEAYEAGRASR